MERNPFFDRCSVCGTPFEDTGKKQQCRACGMFANLCCDPQMPIQLCILAEKQAGLKQAAPVSEPESRTRREG